MKAGSVFVSGNFNVLHPGHLRLLRFARECGTRLVIGVNSDRIAGDSAHVPQALRLEGVQSLGWGDEVFLLDVPVADAIAKLHPDIVVKGKEHEDAHNPEEAALASYGGKLIFSSGEVAYSSLDLLQKEINEPRRVSRPLPNDYLARRSLSKVSLRKIIEGFSSMRVVVVGDLIVDEYITCEPLGMSQEDPTIVVTPVDSTLFVGGAGIVAAHAAGLGASVKFITVSGNDPAHFFAKMALDKNNVDALILVDPNRPTTLKQRYRSKGKTLLRVSHLHQASIASDLQKKLLAAIRRAIKQCDLLVFSDFNYGCLPKELVREAIALGKERGIPMVADSQSSSQIGDLGKFVGMDLLTPTEREARITTRDQESGLVVLAETLRQQTQAKNVLLKMGEEGVLIHAGRSRRNSVVTDRIPALNPAPKDVAGAGDSMLIACSMALAGGADIWSAAALGATAAAIQVSRVGNRPITHDELLQEIH